MMFRNSKNFIGDNTIEGLDELARVTVSNDNETQDDVCESDFHIDFEEIDFVFFLRRQVMTQVILEKHGMLNTFYEGKFTSKNVQCENVFV